MMPRGDYMINRESLGPGNYDVSKKPIFSFNPNNMPCFASTHNRGLNPIK